MTEQEHRSETRWATCNRSSGCFANPHYDNCLSLLPRTVKGDLMAVVREQLTLNDAAERRAQLCHDNPTRCPECGSVVDTTADGREWVCLRLGCAWRQNAPA